MVEDSNIENLNTDDLCEFLNILCMLQEKYSSEEQYNYDILTHIFDILNIINK